VTDVIPPKASMSRRSCSSTKLEMPLLPPDALGVEVLGCDDGGGDL
jgi:hypothetical protein